MLSSENAPATLERPGARPKELALSNDDPTCECGCGLHPGFYQKSHKAKGQVEGTPRRFAPGHHMRKDSPEFIVAENGCWIWQRALNTDGYGVTKEGGVQYQAHRVYYERVKEPIPDGLVIDHLCRTPACVNPDHLEAVTVGENTARGQSPTALLAPLNVCGRGHEFTPENTIVQGDGRRRCRRCRNASKRVWARQARRND